MKAKLGYAIQVKTFMTDITNVFINAWVAVMGTPERQLYCNWHIDQAWQKNLRKKIKDNEKRSWVYKTLKCLHYEENDIFVSNLDSAIELFCNDKDTADFGNYFRENYVKNCKLWAMYYRKGCGINTNMYLESMHKVIKYSHLDGKVVKRLDKGLNAVLKYIKRKIIDRIQKNTKGKVTRKSREILSRHETATVLDLKLEIMPNNTFKATNKNNHSEEYEIKKMSENVCCKLLCKFCHICVHCFQCNCLDFLTKNTICKHIHFVVLNTSNISENELSINNESCVENVVHLGCLKESNKENHLMPNIKDKIKIEINEIMTKMENSSNDNILKQTYEYLKQANLILNIDTSTLASTTTTEFTDDVMSSINNEPPNKKIKKQLNFTSTRTKTSKKKASSIQKANKEEQEIIKDTLNHELFISKSDCNDHNYCKV